MRLSEIPETVARATGSDGELPVRDAFCALVGPDAAERYEGTPQEAAHALEAACIGLAADDGKLPMNVAYTIMQAENPDRHLFVCSATYAQGVDYVQQTWRFFADRIEAGFAGKVVATDGPYRTEVLAFVPGASERERIGQDIATVVASIGAAWQTFADLPRGRRRDLQRDMIQQLESDLVRLVEKRDRLDFDNRSVG